MQKEVCKTCNHESHDLGKCKNCNCGENEIFRSSDLEFYHEKDFGDFIESLYDSPNVLMNEKGSYKLC